MITFFGYCSFTLYQKILTTTSWSCVCVCVCDLIFLSLQVLRVLSFASAIAFWILIFSIFSNHTIIYGCIPDKSTSWLNLHTFSKMDVFPSMCSHKQAGAIVSEQLAYKYYFYQATTAKMLSCSLQLIYISFTLKQSHSIFPCK